MSNKRYTFAPPVFASRVLRARMLIELSGKRFVWSDSEKKFVLTDKREEVENTCEQKD
jgi:hypothetical protein